MKHYGTDYESKWSRKACKGRINVIKPLIDGGLTLEDADENIKNIILGDGKEIW